MKAFTREISEDEYQKFKQTLPRFKVLRYRPTAQ